MPTQARPELVRDIDTERCADVARVRQPGATEIEHVVHRKPKHAFGVNAPSSLINVSVASSAG
jgi:hypothetical protein